MTGISTASVNAAVDEAFAAVDRTGRLARRPGALRTRNIAVTVAMAALAAGMLGDRVADYFRPLTYRQQAVLDTLADAIATKTGRSPVEVWNDVKSATGSRSRADLTESQYHTAARLLSDELARALLSDAAWE